MTLPAPAVLIPLGHSALIAIGSVLASATVSRFVAPRRVGHAIVLSLPVLAGTIGAYYALGFSGAADLLLAVVVCCGLFVAGGVVLSADPPKDETPMVPASASLLFVLALIIMLGGFTSYATPALLIALTMASLLSLNLLARQEMPGLSHEKAVLRRSPGLMACAAAALVPLSILVGVSTWQLARAGSHDAPILVPEVVIVVMGAPAIVVPTLIAALSRAWSGDSEGAIGLSCGVAVIAGGLLLPALILLPFGLSWWHGETASHMNGLPPVSWRLDAPPLLAAGFALLGLRAQLLPRTRWIGLMLLLLYFSYLLANALVRTSV